MIHPLVWIQILTYNDWDETEVCLDSLNQIDYPNYLILIVDNGSSPGSDKNIRTKFPKVNIIRIENNDGYTGGVNFGLKYLKDKNADYILVLNNDTVVTKNFLSEMVVEAEKEKNSAIIGCTILCEHNRDEIWYAGGQLIPWRAIAIHWNKGNIYEPTRNLKPKKVTFVTGCIMLLRNSFLSDIGLQDERIFLYLDDIEYSARVLAKGYDLLYVPNAVIYHKVFGEKENPRKLYYSARNRLFINEIWNKGITKLLSKFYFIFVWFFKLIYWRINYPVFFRAAKAGIEDHLRKKYHRGRGNEF